MRKISVYAVLCLATLLFFTLVGCNPGGGSGAEFDDTLYYTKTEVNTLIDAAVIDAVNQAETALADYSPTTVSDSDGPKEVQTAGYANKVGPWTVPEGALYGIFQIIMPGFVPTGAEHVIIGPNDSESTEFSVYHVGEVMHVVVPTTSNLQVYAWLDFDTSSGTEFVAITDLVWLK